MIINLASIMFVLWIQFLAAVLLYYFHAKENNTVALSNSKCKFWIPILGGSLPLALLGAGFIETDPVAVILALVGFVYFIVFK